MNLILALEMLLSMTIIEGTKWKTIWKEDFNGKAGNLPSSKNWIFDVGTSYVGGPENWGTGETQTYTNSTDNIRLDGKGNLMIIPLKGENGKWTSARIETVKNDFKPKKNEKLAIEARIQMPNVEGNKALGYWPAFWAIGSPLRGNYWNWPKIGEFDIMENVNGLDRVWGVLHCGVNPGGPCKETDGLGDSRQCPGMSCQSGFHTYRFESDESTTPKELRWYVDGKQYHKVTSSDVGEQTWSDMTGHGYFILLNVAMGGAFPNGVSGISTPTPDTEPGHPMLVDFVAVYSSSNCKN